MLLKLVEIQKHAADAIRWALNDTRCSTDNALMLPVAISLLNFNIRELNEITHGMFEGEE